MISLLEAYIYSCYLSIIFLIKEALWQAHLFLDTAEHYTNNKNMVYILLGVASVALLSVLILFFVFRKDKKGSEPDKKDEKKKKSTLKSRDKNGQIKECQKRLSSNPKDAEALGVLADFNFKDGVFDKAMKSYEVLIDLCATNPDIDEFMVTARYALCCLKIGRMEEAYKSYTIARSMKADEFEVNSNLGLLEYKKKNFDKAIQLLNQAKSIKPEDPQTLRTLGHALFKTKRYKDAAAFLRKAIDIEPEDKESIFSLAQCYHEIGQNENAIQIFTHLRPDPVWGPSAALFAGTIHLNSKEVPKAVMDFEIGLKHKDIKTDIRSELMYRLANAYLKNQDINKALELLRSIHQMAPNYKDVSALLRQYQELQSNQNLQIYLMAQTSDFLTLCRKLTETIYNDAKVKIVDISVIRNEYADILAEVHAKKWEDLVLFRFIRTKGTVGELVLRDMYARTKELKAGRGYCFTAGEFSDEAKTFVEARLIDLFEKTQLTQRLKSIKTVAI